VTYPDGLHTTDLFMPGTVPSFAPVTAPLQPLVAPFATGTPTTILPKPPVATGYPYCPSDFNFVAPTPGNGVSNPGWW